MKCITAVLVGLSVVVFTAGVAGAAFVGPQKLIVENDNEDDNVLLEWDGSDVVGNATDTGGTGQQWTLTDQGTYYTITNVATGKLLTETDIGGLGNNVALADADASHTHQKWTITPDDPGFYTIKSVDAVKSLEIYEKNAGTYSANTKSWQDWQIVPEPATMVLLGLGGAGLLIRRRRS